MNAFIDRITSSIGVTDVLDIIIVAFIVYKVIQFVQETRAQQLAKGVLVFVGITALSKFFNLYTLHWIMSETMTVGLLAIVIIFQPELRRALEYLGRNSFSKMFRVEEREEDSHIMDEIAKALESMSETKTGALMVFEKETQLTDIIETGTIIDAAISEHMIGNIFYEGAPLHDGALIVRGGRLYAAGCVLPLTQNKSLGKELGTRHRAGIGITEVSDAITLIVSEETGVISVASNGNLKRFLNREGIIEALSEVYTEQKQEKNPVKRTLKKAFKRG